MIIGGSIMKKDHIHILVAMFAAAVAAVINCLVLLSRFL